MEQIIPPIRHQIERSVEEGLSSVCPALESSNRDHFFSISPFDLGSVSFVVKESVFGKNSPRILRYSSVSQIEGS